MPDWFDQVYEAIHTHQYYGLASLLLFGLLYATKKFAAKAPPTSKIGAFLKSDRGSVLMLLFYSLVGGFATAVGHGTKIDGPLVWTAIKTAGGASFIFSLVFKLAFPKDGPPVVQPAPAIDPANPPLPVPPVMPSSKPPVWLLWISLPFFAMTSCACWQPQNPQYNSKGCVVARGTVACAEQAGLAIATVLVSMTLPAADVLLTALENEAGPAGGCLLAAIGSAITAPNAPAPPASKLGVAATSGELKGLVSDHLARWKQKASVEPATKFCFTGGSCS